MKKVLLMSLAAAFSFSAFAQEEDVTHLITNAGFDEGLTFTDEGKPTSETTATGETGEGARVLLSANGDYYAEPTDGKGTSVSGDLSWYGFLGAPKGWTVAKEYATTKPFWKYFGTLPYSLKEGYLGAGRGSNGNAAESITAPAKPEADDTDDNTGFLYMRAGWGGAVAYQQTVSLPCAKYRLEYWTINLNTNVDESKPEYVASDLTKVICRKDEFSDPTGLSATEWTKHEFEFTPTSDFTLQFGYKSGATGSNKNPWIIVDGVKLYKVGEASLEEIYTSDLTNLYDELQELSGKYADYSGLANQIDNATEIVDKAMNSEDADLMKKTLDEVTALKDSIIKTADIVPSITVSYNKATAAAAKAYPGLADLQTVLAKYDKTINNGKWEDIVAYATELKQAYLTYMMSQVASADTPADYTFLVQNPMFVKEGSEPTIENGVFTYPNQDTFEVGKAPEVATSEGWTKTGTCTDGDQRLNYAQGRICWNAWKANTDGKTLEVSQVIKNLPNGYYKVSGDLITQDGFVNDQHVFATSSLQSSNSASLTEGLWNDNNAGTWTTLTSDKVLVHDGGLTIGASGTLANQNQSGWFCATNFQLLYLGAATQAEIEAALAAKAENAKALVAAMHFGADKAAANDSIAEYTTTGDIVKLNAAIKLAQNSEAKYAEINAEGKTIPTVAVAVADGTYGEATEIAKSAYDNTLAYINNGTYNKVDSIITILKAYVNNYVPAYNTADETLKTLTSATAKEVLSFTMTEQKKGLMSELKSEAFVKTAIVQLTAATATANAQEAYEKNPNSTDYTGFIINAQTASTDGWNVIKGEGDGPVKKGQYFTDDADRTYFDSWNGTAGKNNIYMDQAIEGLPNGTYTLAANVRTSAEGAFLFAYTGAEAADTTWMEIPVQTYTYIDQTTGKDSTVFAMDKYGKIWEEAKAKIDGGLSETDPNYATYSATYNANGGNGRGWMNLQIPNIEVTNHALTIGVTCDSTKTNKPSKVTWFSATDFTLTLTKAGDNAGWNGPATGITEIQTEALKADAIYNINGQRIANMSKLGLYIVVRNGKAVKVLKK